MSPETEEEAMTMTATKMTAEQYQLGMKLVQTLRDIHEFQFYMPEWKWSLRDRMYSLMGWVNGEAEAEKIKRELGEETIECGMAHCVGGWLMALLGVESESIMGRPSRWFAEQLGISKDDAEFICLEGFEMSKEEKAQQLEEVLNAYYRP